MAGGELTADDRSIILDGVVIMVHIGVTAQVEEFLVAAVMGMAAPRSRQRIAGPHSQAWPIPQWQRPQPSVPVPSRSDLQTEAQRGAVPCLRSHSQAEPGQCPSFLPTILPPCSMPRAPRFPPESPGCRCRRQEASGCLAMWSGWEGGSGLSQCQRSLTI